MTKSLRDGPRSRILLADDEPAVREIVARSLREGGYEVTATEDGWSAWREAQNQPFDLVITDHMMPHMSGTELIRRVRAAFPRLPIIMITGYFIEPDTPAGMPADITILYKPFTGETLLAEVERIMTVLGPGPGHGDAGP
jgi:two-component system response regulator MprA